jgi:hypothetical protein
LRSRDPLSEVFEGLARVLSPGSEESLASIAKGVEEELFSGRHAFPENVAEPGRALAAPATP